VRTACREEATRTLNLIHFHMLKTFIPIYRNTLNF